MTSGNAMTRSSGPLKPETVLLLTFLFISSTGYRVQGPSVKSRSVLSDWWPLERPNSIYSCFPGFSVSPGNGLPPSE